MFPGPGSDHRSWLELLAPAGKGPHSSTQLVPLGFAQPHGHQEHSPAWPSSWSPLPRGQGQKPKHFRASLPAWFSPLSLKRERGEINVSEHLTIRKEPCLVGALSHLSWCRPEGSERFSNLPKVTQHPCQGAGARRQMWLTGYSTPCCTTTSTFPGARCTSSSQAWLLHLS